jgi:hypothetical protein
MPAGGWITSDKIKAAAFALVPGVLGHKKSLKGSGLGPAGRSRPRRSGARSRGHALWRLPGRPMPGSFSRAFRRAQDLRATLKHIDDRSLAVVGAPGRPSDRGGST